jgi:dimethylamine/trimethylamine dehydrogenase
MPRDAKYDVLFEPVRLGPHVMRNRFYKTPHCTSFGSEKPGTQAYFRATAAEGGWAAVSTEACSIHPSSDLVPEILARLWDDSDIRNLSLMTERIHEHGSLAGVQLWYAGVHAPNYESRGTPRGVSQVVSDYAPFQSSYEMDKDEIRELQGWYVAAAERGRDAGFDIINLHGGHGGPITYQFLDPFYNKRTDEYGGSFENRARFYCETLENVRAAVGDQCAIAVRICLDSLRAEGLTTEETIRFIEHADGLVDVWDFQLGAILSEWGEDSLASRFAPENFQLEWLKKVSPHTEKPVVGVGRFVSPDVMVKMITSGILDIIGSARGSIADPFLPKKIEEGRLDDIRECIGCNVCASRVNQSAPLVCTQNATAGEEYRRGWHPEKVTKAANADSDVLVVGAGPAGMECAMILGKRGMRRVHLVEAQDDMGGIMRWIPQLPGLGEWRRIIDYRKIQIAKLRNVEFVPNTKLDVQAARDYGAEIVIIATGAHWATDGRLDGVTQPIAGADASRPHVFTPEQIVVEKKSIPGERVVVYDCEGYFVGVGLAELLAREGKHVTFITPHSQVAPYTFFTLEGFRINRLLHELGVEIVQEHMITEVREGSITGHHCFAEARVREWEADGVVLVTQRVSDDSLYRDLRSDPEVLAEQDIAALYRIGDCVVPRIVAETVFDGHRLAREIDTDNPREPVRFIRENRVLGFRDDDYDLVLQRDGAAVVSTARSSSAS